MKERPILFKADMVNAILEGRKTQTRRVIGKDLDISSVGKYEQWARELASNECFGRKITEKDIQNKTEQLSGSIIPFFDSHGRMFSVRCPYGKVGDQLWVRETFRLYNKEDECSCYEYCGCPSSGTPVYKADSNYSESKWKPSIFMPRWASRIQLEITDIRVERLNDISEDDARAEGIKTETPHQSPVYFDYLKSTASRTEWFMNPVSSFQSLWQSINGKDSWNENPWVWVIGFKHLKEQGD